MPYRYVLACEVAEDILEPSAGQRGEFVRLFRSLAENPFEPGERSFKDSSGRDIQKKILVAGGCLIGLTIRFKK